MLGVEGLDDDTVLKALDLAGITAQKQDDRRDTVTKKDLYLDGFCGAEDAAAKRESLCRALGLPTRLSANLLPKVISDLFDRQEYERAVEQVKAEFVAKS